MVRQYTIREFRLLLADNGWTFTRQSGDHLIYYKGSKHLSVPMKKLNKMFARRLIREYDLKEV